MSDLLSVSALQAGYGTTIVLEDIHFALPQRGALAILGRNGVGKTTLLATLMGHTTLHAGEIVFSGMRIERMPVFERATLGLGFVPQTRDIFRSLTVEENLLVAQRGAGQWNLSSVYKLFPRLKERRRNMGTQLSGGEQQMLTIGRALMGNPKLLILDEPLEGLSPINVDSLMEVIRKLIARELAIVLVEQSARRALEVTQDAIVLDRGRIAWRGESPTLLQDPELLSNLMIPSN
ncbi:ABC transporter ATP-binding protein [Burkholderia sp. K24]|jgi:branched-chain amino acid transport system ATP-binding protein|uniref:ABC transporter ATP-binding protein n=1 Tax=Paraburkholderia fungorum TaxID=134537 RepID=UPI0004AAC5AC|nr:ABC transporter ATP-binding protein [Paraburkholderia fungorum]KFX63935.1 ABC transporter ATP-binding protein [Burkholderia sp. K24]MBU7436192.1 ABC transporter ATP-binding protein [Paraburkholderia fungorum]